MAQCQNFFDDTSPSACRSSCSTDQSPPELKKGCADHGLDLCLGPSMDANKTSQHEMVRPIPLYPSLDKQRSGNFAHATENSPLFKGHSDVAMADKVLFSKESAFYTPPRISREQVWQTLQKTNAVLRRKDACTSKDFCEDAASSMWGRRATSMQIVMPSNELSEADACPIRRSCSNGVALSNQSSLGQEALVDESPDPTNSLPYNWQQEALELQKKREMQAHRRLEARKRRRFLLEGKQQKKARQNSGINNRLCISQVEREPLVRTRSKDRNCELQPYQKNHYEGLQSQPGGDRLKGRYGRDNVCVEDTSPVEGGKLNKPFDGMYDKALSNAEKMMMHKECESYSCRSKHIEGCVTSSLQIRVESHDSMRTMQESSQARRNIDAVEGVKSMPSSCSETESKETKGQYHCKERDSSEPESSSQKSSTENHCNQNSSVNVALSKSMLHPHALPRTGSGIPTVPANLVLPSLTQCSDAASDALPIRHTTSVACKPSNAVGDPVPNSFAIKKSVGMFSEGKWETLDENPAFLPIRRTTSNITEAVTDAQCSAKQLDTRVPAAASQLKFARMGLDSAADASHKNRTDVSCEETLACASRLYLHNVEVKKECDSYIEQEKPTVGLKGPGPTRDLPPDMIGSGICKAKVKQEEDMTSFEDHLVSKHQEPYRGSNVHIGVVNRQRSLSLLDLPWVTTTGRGPNGKTINGVMYISGGRSVWLVCRCHGKHMSPAEFVEHSGSTDLSNPLKNIVVNPSPLFNLVGTTPV